jgi:hypothetical protein
MAKKIQLKKDSAPVQQPASGGAFIAERHRLDSSALQARPASNYVFAGICSILALLVYIAILAILWLEWDALKMA